MTIESIKARLEAAKASMDTCEWENDFDPKGCACVVCRQRDLCAALAELEGME